MPPMFIICAEPIDAPLSRKITVKPTPWISFTVAIKFRWSRSLMVVAFIVSVVGIVMMPGITVTCCAGLFERT